MKPLSICMATAMLALAGAAFTPKPTGTNTSQAAPITATTMRWMLSQSYFHSLDFLIAKPAKAAARRENSASRLESSTKRDMSFYWFTYPEDDYVDYNTVAGEEWDLWLSLGGVIINTNSIGGTLLEEGYIDYGWPQGVPYVFLYGHFVM